MNIKAGAFVLATVLLTTLSATESETYDQEAMPTPGPASTVPAASLGLRFRLTKKSHVNFRLNLAAGRDGHTVTVGIGEAF
jgi:hypothetical protein